MRGAELVLVAIRGAPTPALPPLSCSAAEKLEERLFVRHADVLPGLLAVLEDEDGRDAADAVTLGDARRVVDVELGDLVLADGLVRDFLDDRSEHFAGAAPRGGEIDEDGLRRLEDFLIEIRVGELDDVLAGHVFRSWGIRSFGVGDTARPDVKPKTPMPEMLPAGRSALGGVRGRVRIRRIFRANDLIGNRARRRRGRRERRRRGRRG